MRDREVTLSWSEIQKLEVLKEVQGVRHFSAGGEFVIRNKSSPRGTDYELVELGLASRRWFLFRVPRP